MQIGTSSTTPSGGESFKHRKPIGEVACCESQMAERIHWSTERWLRSPQAFSLYFSLFLRLPTYYLSMYLSIYLSIFLSTCLSIYLSIYMFLSIYRAYLSINLSIFLSIFVSIYLSVYYLSFFLSFCQSIYPSIHQSPAPAISNSIYEIPLLYFNRHCCSGCRGQLDQTLGRADLTLQCTVLEKTRVEGSIWRIEGSDTHMYVYIHIYNIYTQN